jgi:ADP-heptose:LPS heptosyltransferase
MHFRKICIIHLNQIGDLVFSLPLLKSLKDNFPDAAIHSVVRPFLQDLLAESPWVDRILLRVSSLKAKLELLKEIRRSQYDLLICLGRSEESLMLTLLSGAKLKAGFANFFWDWGLDLKENIEGHNSWYNNAKLLRLLNIKISQNNYVGLLNVNEDKSLRDLPAEFAVISPAASRRRQIKAWAPEKFAELIILLQQNFRFVSVLVGSNEDKTYNHTVMDSVKEKAGNNSIDIINFTGNTGLGRLCLVLKQASLFVGIDSGVMHLASSLDIPVVGLFGPTDPRFVGPQNSRSRVVSKDDMDCVPCYLKPCDHRNCMNELGVETVLAACRQVISEIGN